MKNYKQIITVIAVSTLLISLTIPKQSHVLDDELNMTPRSSGVASVLGQDRTGGPLSSGNCSSCHSGDKFTDAATQLHYPDVIGTDPMLASRSLTGKYRTTPLAGAWQHPPYFHDGSAATLLDVVEHYNNHFALGLMPSEKDDLVQYLLSL